MKRFLIRTMLFLSPMVIATILLFVMPYDKKFAYCFTEKSCFNRGEYVHSRIFENQTRIDIAFIGTSHTLNAIQDSSLEASLNVTIEEPLHLANLSYCWQGLNTQYIIVKDLLENKSPKLIIFEVREWEDNSNHKIFPYIADANDIRQQPYLYKLSCFSNIYVSAVARFNYFKHRDQYEDSIGFISDNYGYESNQELADSNSLLLNYQRQQINYAGPDGIKLDDQMKNYDRYYFNKMMNICKEKNVKVCFLYLPSFGDVMNKPLNHELYTPFGEIYIPPKEIRDNKNYWANTSHLNNEGAIQLTKWLSTQDIYK